MFLSDVIMLLLGLWLLDDFTFPLNTDSLLYIWLFLFFFTYETVICSYFTVYKMKFLSICSRNA